MKKKDVLNMSLAERVHFNKFDNGLKVYVIPDHSAPAVTVQAWVGTGSMHEGKYLGCGLSHFLEHMAFAGTERFPGTAIAEKVNELGGQLNAFTSYASTVYYMNLPSEHWTDGLDMLDDMLRSPLFPEERFLLEKDVILRECDMYQDRADSVLFERLWNTAFVRHPMGHPVIGYKDKIATVNRNMMMDYYRERYTPGRIFFVIAGDVDSDAVFGYLNASAGTWARGAMNDIILPSEPEQTFARYDKSYFNDPLYRFGTAWKIPALSHYDAPALDLFAMILGNGTSSRLFRKVKNELELAVDIDSFCYANSELGMMGIFAVGTQKNALALKNETMKIVESLRKERVSGAELERAFALQSADYLRAMRTNSGLARTVGGNVMFCAAPDYSDIYLRALSKVTPDDIYELANHYFTDDKLTMFELFPESSDISATRSSGKKKKVEHLPLKKVLPDGQSVIYLEDQRLPLTDIVLLLPGAPAWEPEGKTGVSKLLSQCLDTECAKYSENDFNELLEDNAIDLDVSSGNNMLMIKMNFIAEKLDVATDALSAILSAPLFSERVFKREKADMQELINARASNPKHLAMDSFCRELFGKHPYATAGSVTSNEIKKLTRNDVENFYKKHVLNPGKAVFAVSGAISEKLAFDTVKRICCDIPWNKKAKKPKLPDAPCFEVGEKTHHYTLRKEQALVLLGGPSLAVDSPDYIALEVLRMAENGMSSELFKKIREDEGLAYYTGLQFMGGFNAGFYAYFAGTNPDAAEKVLNLLKMERKRIASGGMTQDEFEAAKKGLTFSMASNLQNSGLLVGQAAVDEFVGRGYFDNWNSMKKLEKLELKDVNKIYRKLFNCKTVHSVIVSPEKNGKKCKN